ncbi:hypothetical protein EDC04DRAFT_533673 [Pisolithus marmoratus]|nr:hypothetical protein EDC04DRAFT_533673 [Pisolithus marmoratus]
MPARTTPNAHYYPSAYLPAHRHEEQGWYSPSSIMPPTSPRWPCIDLPPEGAPCPGCALDAPERRLENKTPAYSQPTFSEPRSSPGSRRAHYTADRGPTSHNSTALLSPLDVPMLTLSRTPMSPTPSEPSYTTDPRPARMRTSFNLPPSSNHKTPHMTTPCAGQLAFPPTHDYSRSHSTPRVFNTVHVTTAPTPKSVRQAKNIPTSLTTHQTINQSSTRTAQTASKGRRSQGPVPRSQDGGLLRIHASIIPCVPVLPCSAAGECQPQCRLSSHVGPRSRLREAGSGWVTMQ